MHQEIFHTERLIARTWELVDLPFALELWGDLDVTRLIDRRGQLDQNQVTQRLQDEISRQEIHGVQYWPLFEMKSGQFIGCCGLRPWILISEEKNYELGFHVIKQCWAKGYATEAAKGTIKYARERLGLTKLYAGHHPQNKDSQKVLLKLGFQHTQDIFYEPTGLFHPSYILYLNAS